MNDISFLLDYMISSGINKTIDSLQSKPNRYTVLEQEIINIKQELYTKIDDTEIKNLFDTYASKANQLEKYKTEAIYKQGILDTIEIIKEFSK